MHVIDSSCTYRRHVHTVKTQSLQHDSYKRTASLSLTASRCLTCCWRTLLLTGCEAGGPGKRVMKCLWCGGGGSCCYFTTWSQLLSNEAVCPSSLLQHVYQLRVLRLFNASRNSVVCVNVFYSLLKSWSRDVCSVVDTGCHTVWQTAARSSLTQWLSYWQYCMLYNCLSGPCLSVCQGSACLSWQCLPVRTVPVCLWGVVMRWVGVCLSGCIKAHVCSAVDVHQTWTFSAALLAATWPRWTLELTQSVWRALELTAMNSRPLGMHCVVFAVMLYHLLICTDSVYCFLAVYHG